MVLCVTGFMPLNEFQPLVIRPLWLMKRDGHGVIVRGKSQGLAHLFLNCIC